MQTETLPVNRQPITVRYMKKERKPLENWQKEDADRLLACWKTKKTKISQLRAASEWGIGDTQGIVWQYLHGAIPLNLPVLIKFASGLGRHPAEISPTLAKQLPSANTSPLGALGNDKNLLQLVGLYLSLNEQNQATVLEEANKLHNKQFPHPSPSNPFPKAKFR